MPVTLSCGHKADDGCFGVEVTWGGEECVAGEGFVPATYYGVFCHNCAEKLAYEKGREAERDRIVAIINDRMAVHRGFIEGATAAGVEPSPGIFAELVGLRALLRSIHDD